MLNFFLECTESVTHAGFRVTSYKGCQLMSMEQLIGNILLIFYAVFFIVSMYHSIMLIASCISSAFELLQSEISLYFERRKSTPLNSARLLVAKQ
jgi:hypothetical protein